MPTASTPDGPGSDRRHEITQVSPDLSQLKALAHPVRVKILGFLRMDGPATATGLAQRLGLNSGATSYHLRQLAQHGLVVEDDSRGNRRDRWWRAAHDSTVTDLRDNADSREVMDAYHRAVGAAHLETLTAAQQERPELPQPWSEIADDSDWALWLTPAQAQQVMDRLHEVMRQAAETSPIHRGDAPDDAEQFLIQLHGFPRPGSVVRPAEFSEP